MESNFAVQQKCFGVYFPSMQAIKLPTDKIQLFFSLHVVESINSMGLGCSSFNECSAYVAETPIVCCNYDRLADH